jgi:hypothetical protein
MTQTNNERQYLSDVRRQRAYNIIKNLAQRTGYMKHERDSEGFTRFCDAFPVDDRLVDLLKPE